MPPRILLSRRELLARSGMGFGAAAASSLLSAATGNPLVPKAPHAPPKAKAVIYLLFMHGGVSHVDTWDPKPELTRLRQTVKTLFAVR